MPVFVTLKGTGKTIRLHVSKQSDLSEVKANIIEALGLQAATDSLKLSCEGRFLHFGVPFDVIRPNITLTVECYNLIGGVSRRSDDGQDDVRNNVMIDTNVDQGAQPDEEEVENKWNKKYL